MATYYVDTAAGSDSNAGTSPGAGNAWATLSHAATVVVAGDHVYAKASASYTETLTISTSGTAAAPVTWEGYAATPGDGGRATITGQTIRAANINLASCSYQIFKNWSLTGATSYSVTFVSPGLTVFVNVAVATKGFAASSGYAALPAKFVGCLFTVPLATGNGGLSPSIFWGCEFFLSSGIALTVGSYTSVGPLTRCLFRGGMATAIAVAATSAVTGDITHCTFQGCSSDAVQINGGGGQATMLANCLFGSNGGYDVNVQNAPTNGTVIYLLDNAHYLPTSGQLNGTAVVIGTEIALAANPFNNPSSGDLSLNTTAGGGAACRAAGFPGAFPGGTTTGYLDVGAVQSQASGGGTVIAGNVVRNIFLDPALGPDPW